MSYRKVRTIVVFVMFFLISPVNSSAWGFYAHKQINRIAIFTLPPDLFGFYKLHIEFITENSVNADKRRYAVKEEACRHYLDADHYEQALPFDTIPPFWKDAVVKFTEDTLNAYGIVPWYLQLMKVRLVAAFKEKDVNKILKLSADIGHYIADLHVPLHSTKNYDGQLTGQSGIHALWESRLPELYSEHYDFFVGRAVFLPDLNAAVWLAFAESFAARDSVFGFEKRISETMSPEMKYSLENKGNNQSKQFSKEFCNAYHSSLDGMVERRMRASMLMVGSVWLTAWVDAGQPKLDGIEERQLDNTERQAQIKEELEFLKGKIIGREEAK